MNKDTLSLFVGSLLLVTLSYNALAQSPTNCANAKTQAEINACAEKEFENADKELNQLYKQVTSKINNSQRAVFIQSQRDWLVFRDHYSNVYLSVFKGGSMTAAAAIQCKTESTRDRIMQLKELLKQVSL